MKANDWSAVFAKLREYASDESPSINQIAYDGADPFQILVATILSLRTRDDVTLKTSRNLFRTAPTVAAVANLSEDSLADLIFPSGFYKTKAKQIKEIAQILLKKYQGKVPNDRNALLELPGVGPKTANLVLNVAFSVNAICVDTHVHRISNRLGWVKTDSPEDTEKALEGILPHEHWIEINPLLVTFGQDICTPASPHCSDCFFQATCPRNGVLHSR